MSGKKVCIFDIDNTLTHAAKAECKTCTGLIPCSTNPGFCPAWPKNSGTSSAVLNTVKACRKGGYEVAVATAESGLESYNPKQVKFLQNVLGEDLYNTPMLQNSCTAQNYNYLMCTGQKTDHPCCNTEHSDKKGMYMNIMNHLGIHPSEFNNSIVFDDAQSNLTAANFLGMKTCQASLNCGGKYCDTGCGIPNGCVHLVNEDDDLTGVV